MRVVNFSILLLLVGCSTVKWPVEPPPLPLPQSKPVFEHAVQASIPQPKYYLIWSNPNPYYVTCVIEHKTSIDSSWKYWSTVIQPLYCETNIPLALTNSQEYFRASFVWP